MSKKNQSQVVEFDPLNFEDNELTREQLQQIEQRQHDEEVHDLEWLLEDERGRRILRGILDRGGLYKPSWNSNSMTMAYNEGRRVEAIRMATFAMTHFPKQYQQMIDEAQNDRFSNTDNHTNQ